MVEQNYTASLSRSQGRESWCVIFRHPLRNGNDGKPGLRIRRGLGTSDENEARELVEEMNQILQNKAYWSATQKENAEQKFDRRIVSAFYDNLMPEFIDSWSIRNNNIEIPDPSLGYSRVLLIGTTGAGKTTLVRQLIGTDPYKERFPSTSAAKTTISDIEIILSDGPFKAVVTFISRERLRQYIEECVSSAIISKIEIQNSSEVERRFLEHNEQRFRLSYLLGTTSLREQNSDQNQLYDEDEEDDENLFEESTELTELEKQQFEERLKAYIRVIEDLSDDIVEKSATALNFDISNANKKEIEAFLELLEDEIYQNDKFHTLVDEVIDDIENKFRYIDKGTVHEVKGWPSHWTYETNERELFIKTINKFSSNYAPNFGKLLTPLVDGIRVQGPFKSKWSTNSELNLVIMDGEGLGHSPDSSTSLSTNITKKFKIADAILLVDNAAQPMQAAPTAALRSLVSSGHESKLIICFTHFDEVKGANLPTNSMKINHVSTSVDNSIKSIGKDLGRQAEISLKNTINDNIVFLSNIQKIVTGKKKFTLAELTKLKSLITKKIEPKDVKEIKITYDDANLVLSIQNALKEFHEPWRAKLGIAVHPNIRSEHWTRIKALTRRLGVLGTDEYSDLKPVADLIRVLSEHIRIFINNPLKVEPATATDILKLEAIDQIAREIFSLLHDFVSDILFKNKTLNWNTAYSYRGIGSSRIRANDVKNIYDTSVPIPGEIPSVDTNLFLSNIRTIIKKGIEAGGGRIARIYK